jgi:hypothetical protein
MTRNQNDQRYEGYSSDWSNQKSCDDYNILEPSADNDFQFQGDEDDELSDFSLMENARDLNFEE